MGETPSGQATTADRDTTTTTSFSSLTPHVSARWIDVRAWASFCAFSAKEAMTPSSTGAA